MVVLPGFSTSEEISRTRAPGATSCHGVSAATAGVRSMGISRSAGMRMGFRIAERTPNRKAHQVFVKLGRVTGLSLD